MFYGSEKQMEKLDVVAVRYGLEIRQMMELAGWHMLNLFKELKITKRANITIVVGKGNKGGDGLAAARHLINHGWDVVVVIVSTKISPDAAHHLRLLRRMNTPIMMYPRQKASILKRFVQSQYLIDSLIGYHLQGPPRGVMKQLIELMNDSGKKIIAYDIPSGMNSTSGECEEPCINAAATLTLALPKRAFKGRAAARKRTGRVYLADIGIPDYFYNMIKRGSRPPFSKNPSSLIRLS